MAVNLPKHATWDPLTSNRAPIVGDVSSQYDITTDTHRTAVYDGQRWQEITNNVSANINGPTRFVGSGVTMNSGVGAGNGTYSTVSSIANTWKNDLFQMFAEHVRVAEYVDNKGKIEKVQLEWREGTGSNWEPIERVRIKL